MSKTTRNVGIDFLFFGGGVVKYEVDATLRSRVRSTLKDLLLRIYYFVYCLNKKKSTYSRFKKRARGNLFIHGIKHSE